METAEWCLAVLLRSGRKILFNVSTITFPGVIYSGMLMCLESTGPCGPWHRFLRAFLSSIRSGTAQAPRCCWHLFNQQRLMQQESIDNPAVRQHGRSICARAHFASLFLFCPNWLCNLHFNAVSFPVEANGLLGMPLARCKLCIYVSSQLWDLRFMSWFE